MDLADRERFLSDVASGQVALRDVGGLSSSDVMAIARVGAAALQGGRFEQAEQVFSALAALEPDVPLHWLHVAAARQGRGDGAGAADAVSSFLQKNRADDEDVARAYLLRAELVGASNPQQARQDLAAARALTSASAKKLVDSILGAR